MGKLVKHFLKESRDLAFFISEGTTDHILRAKNKIGSAPEVTVLKFALYNFPQRGWS